MTGLEIGAGNSDRKGFIHTDLNLILGHHIEVVCRGEQLPFKDKSFHSVFMWGVFEHFTSQSAESVIRECNRVLINNGSIEFTVPDLINVCKIIVEDKLPFEDGQNRRPRDYALSCLYGGQDRPGQIHQWGWTREALTELLTKFRFTIVVIDDIAYEPKTHIHVIARKTDNEN